MAPLTGPGPGEDCSFPTGCVAPPGQISVCQTADDSCARHDEIARYALYVEPNNSAEIVVNGSEVLWRRTVGSSSTSPRAHAPASPRTRPTSTGRPGGCCCDGKSREAAAESKMKAITIRQPWAWAVVHAGKDIENRTWSPSHRGELAIHAAARMHTHTSLPEGVRSPDTDALTLGAVIGVVDLVDVVEQSRSRWFIGPLGLVLAKPRPLERPVPCRGALNLWNLPDDVEREVRAQLRRA